MTYWERYKHDFLRWLFAIVLLYLSFSVTDTVLYLAHGEPDVARTAASIYSQFVVFGGGPLAVLLSLLLAAVTAFGSFNRLQKRPWIWVTLILLGILMATVHFRPGSF